MAPASFTKLLGCRLPLQLAGMGGVGTVALAAAVARAGGVGMLPVLAAQPIGERVRDAVEAAGPGGVIGVNQLMPFVQPDASLEAIDAGARLVEFFYGDPDRSLVAPVRAAGALVSWQVGSADEARRAVEVGADVVVAQGVEAGGHVRGVTPLLALLDEIIALDLAVPVVAAGGISTGRHVAAALAAGADAVRIGTRFVATVEADAHPQYVEALVRATAADTTLTTAFGNGWPDAPHRVLARCVDAAAALPPDTPWRFAPNPPGGASRAPEAMAMYAGTGVTAIHRVEPAESLARTLMDEARTHLQRAATAV